MDIEHEIEVAASPEDVYPWVATQERQLQWIGGLVSARPTEGSADALPSVGDRFTQRVERGPLHLDLEGTVTVAEAPTRYAFRASGRDFDFVVDLELAATNGGTRVRQRSTVELGNFALKLMASKIRSELETKQREDLQRLAGLVVR